MYEFLTSKFGPLTENKNVAEFLNDNLFKYGSSISEKDLIVELSSKDRPNLVITKRPDDFGMKEYKNGNKIYKIPAPVFLYLMGYVESLDYDK